MNKQQAVQRLVSLIWQRFRDVPIEEIESVLVEEGWAISAVREATSAYLSTRQFL
jgi:hypothetical protein